MVHASFNADLLVIIKSKYSLPPSLQMLTHVVCAYDVGFQVMYGGITNGLIGLTWPVSIPLIRYLYKKPIKDQKQDEKLTK
jgi:hypothetical protein